MIVFSEIEQRTSDLDWYAVDLDGHIGQFLTGGRLLPPRIAADKDTFELLSEYFLSLPQEGEFAFCPDFEAHCREKHRDPDSAARMPFSQKMSCRGIFSYDANHDDDYFFRVSVPTTKILLLEDLPIGVADVLSKNRLSSFRFSKDTTIPEINLRKF